MRWNLNRVRTEYMVNEKARVVVCQITAVDDFNTRLVKYGFEPRRDKKGTVKCYRGVARCHPEDEWNETFGKRLAEYRASQKRVNSVNKEIEDFIETLQRDSLRLVKYGIMKQPRYPAFPGEEMEENNLFEDEDLNS